MSGRCTLLKRGIPSVTGALGLVLLFTGLSTGCVERLLQIRSDPPGARVFINGKQAGETPLDHHFAFYGTLGIVLRREGYASAHIAKELPIPWYEHFPLDLFAELFVPWTMRDVHEVEARLEPVPDEIDLNVEDDLDERAAQAREQVMKRIEEAEKRASSTPDAPPESDTDGS